MRRLIDVGQNNEYRCHSMANKWIFTETQIHWNGFIFLSKKNKIPFRSIIYVKPKIGFSPHSLIRFIRKKFTRTNEVQFIFVKCLTSFFYGFQQRINSKFSTHISRPLHKNGGKKKWNATRGCILFITLFWKCLLLIKPKKIETNSRIHTFALSKWFAKCTHKNKETKTYENKKRKKWRKK